MNCQHYSDAEKYAELVISGEIPACKNVIQACQRFINELKLSSTDQLKYYFCHATADSICKFIETQRHYKGVWGCRKQLISLEPWQKFIFFNLYGWKNKKDGLNRFKTARLSLPRKNGTSLIHDLIELVNKEFGVTATQNDCDANKTFSITYVMDDGDDWKSPTSLKKANPNFGVSLPENYLLHQRSEAIKHPSLASNFIAKHLNVSVG